MTAHSHYFDSRALWLLVLFLALGCLLAATSQTGLPWEGPLDLIRASLTGPMAAAIVLLGVFVSVAGIIWAASLMTLHARCS